MPNGLKFRTLRPDTEHPAGRAYVCALLYYELT